VKVIHAPDQAALSVAPSTEVFHVQIANGEDAGSLGEIGTDLRPDLHPAIIGGTQERKNRSLHAAVFEAQIWLDEVGVTAEPFLEAASRFDYVHSAPRYEHGLPKST